ncbi:type II toxin-antitoxin system PemK/MazF family toxin [Paenibacillus sp. J2TS4]|uniref:type II toxin-antitoxin system PemK/MazF family toxin n=1 Tax=Paenibacillus sp. J2TS4 TaxID=2807194 RepID=UPI001B2CA863|nr:type II toxin-antitoxin system PemK/MazF family toxin [Paenibacillus sp. J2TS4]GIP34770.1 hypothetical protein J2TS4_39800 [Paenibacillus sp. J2TS4]
MDHSMLPMEAEPPQGHAVEMPLGKHGMLGAAEGSEESLISMIHTTGPLWFTKLKLFSECEQVKLTKDSRGKYTPHYERRDIVHCKFSGVGSEYSGGHYAIVWEDNPYFEDITVIPATSQRKTEHANVFPVGKLRGLPQGCTTLLVSDLTRISRKRITSHHGKLHPAWESRICQAIAVTFEKERTLEEIVREQCGAALPENLPLFAGLRFRPSRFIGYCPDRDELAYRLWNETKEERLTMLSPKKPFSIKRKKTLMKNMFYGCEEQRAEALELYERYYGDGARREEQPPRGTPLSIDG